MATIDSTTPMMCRVTDADYLGGHRLHLTFSDGLEGDLDLADFVSSGVFSPLSDPKKFSHFGLIYGTLVWKPNGTELDIAPEYLYQQVVNCLPEENRSGGFEYFDANSWQ